MREAGTVCSGCEGLPKAGLDFRVVLGSFGCTLWEMSPAAEESWMGLSTGASQGTKTFEQTGSPRYLAFLFALAF